MKEYWRIIDANTNRAAEGLRVLEDLVRFLWDDPILQKELRELRHTIRDLSGPYCSCCLSARSSLEDPGFKVSEDSGLDDRTDVETVIKANSRRAEESIRVLEETYKLLGYYKEGKTAEALRPLLYSFEKALLNKIIPEKRRNPLNTDIYGITAAEFSAGRNNLFVVKEMLKGGIKIIQYREKDLKKKQALEECREIRLLTKEAGARFIVNDDPVLAVETGADGVHVGQDDYPVAAVRKIVGPDMIIGLSTHSPEQADRAVRDGADYIGVGPIFATKTKKDVCDPVGLEYLDYVVKNHTIPFTAIGGIKENNIEEVIRAGAKTVALVTEITGSQDIPDKIVRLRSKWRITE